MGFLKRWWRGTKSDGREFTEEDTDKSAITRLEKAIRKKKIEHLRKRLEILSTRQEEQLLQEQVENLEDDLYGDEVLDDDETVRTEHTEEQDNPDVLIMQLLNKAFQGRAIPPGGTPVSQQGQVSNHQKINLTNDQLLEYKTRIPKQFLKRLQKMNDDDIIQTGRQYAPDFFESIDEDTKQRAIKIIRQ